MKSLRVPALVLGVLLAAIAGGIAWQEMRVAGEAAAAQNTELRTAAANTQTLLTKQFERSATVALLLADDAHYADFLKAPGTTTQKINRDPKVRADITDQLQYVQTLFPGAVARSGFVDLRNGQEVVEIVSGQVTTPITLESNADRKLPFVDAVRNLPKGWVTQSLPYFSKETNQWVIANAAGIHRGGETVGLVYFETALDSIRAIILEREGNATIRVITQRNGLVTIDSRTRRRRPLTSAFPQTERSPNRYPASTAVAWLPLTMSRSRMSELSPLKRCSLSTATTGSSPPPRQGSPSVLQQPHNRWS